MCAISITQAITAEHPEPQHCSTHPSLPRDSLLFLLHGQHKGTGPCQIKET